MEAVSVRIAGSRRSGEGLYEAVLEVEYGGRVYRVTVPKLLREPGEAEARIEGDYVVIDLRDAHGGPLATCCIHRSHLERGCMECPSLLLPAP